MKHSIREAMLGPSVLLWALSAISTSSCKAAFPRQTPRLPATLSQQDGETPPPSANPMTSSQGENTTNDNPNPEGPKDAPPAPPNPAALSPFILTAKAVQTNPKVGEPLDLVIEVKNISDTAQTLHFTSGKRFDFQAFKMGETQPVWTWSAGRMFAMVLRDQIVDPDTVATYKAKWPSPPAGQFTIKAKLTANGGIDAPPFEVEIVQP